MDEDATQLMELSDQLNRLLLHDLSRLASQSGLSLPQSHVLFHLYHHPGLEMGEFCRHTTMSSTAASQMIDRLVRQGLVQRVESAADRRVRLISLSEDGQAVIRGNVHSRETWMAGILSGFTPGEKETIARALPILLQGIRAATDPLIETSQHNKGEIK